MKQIKLEQAIIGSILIKEKLFSEYEGIITEADFSDKNTKTLWRIMTNINEKRRPIEIQSVNYEFDNMKYLTACIDAVGFIHNFPDYVTMLKEQALRQQIKELYATEKDIDKLIDKIITLPRYQKTVETGFDDILEQAHKAAITSHGTGFKFNLAKLQEVTGGLEKGELLVLGGYTSFGKTSLAIHLSTGFAKEGDILLYCTAEMSETEIARRLYANQAKINITKLRKALINKEENDDIIVAKNIMKGWKYTIRRVATVADVQREITKHNPEIVIVDHLQNLVSPDKRMGKTDAVTANISRLQTICLSEKLGMIVLSQLHRPPDKTKLRKPELRSFRSSGEIEEKATIAVSVWWENQAKNTVYRHYNAEPEEYEIRVLKNRDGQCGYGFIGFYPEYSLFENFKEGGNENKSVENLRSGEKKVAEESVKPKAVSTGDTKNSGETEDLELGDDGVPF